MNLCFAQVLAERGDTRPFPCVDANEMWALLGSIVCDQVSSTVTTLMNCATAYHKCMINSMSSHQCSHKLVLSGSYWHMALGELRPECLANTTPRGMSSKFSFLEASFFVVAWPTYCYYYLRVLYFANFCDLEKIAKLSTRKNFYHHIRHFDVTCTCKHNQNL